MTKNKLRWKVSSMALAGALLLGACATDDDPNNTVPGDGTTLPGVGTTTTMPGMGTTTLPGGTTSTVGS